MAYILPVFPLSTVAFFASYRRFRCGLPCFSKLFPGRTIKVEEPEKPVSTGNTELDAILNEGRTAIKEMGRLYSSIPEPSVKSRIMEIMNISDKIIKNAVDDPKDIPAIRKFLNYYLPTTIKLLNAYDRMYAQGVEGSNISGTMSKIEDMLDTIVAAYNKQLDSLFADEALDIETDIRLWTNAQERRTQDENFKEGCRT